MSNPQATVPVALSTALADRYDLLRELGRGGMAVVYLARDLKHQRQVAIKVLKPELGALLGEQRFLAEIKVTANLQHPNLLPLFDSGAADGLLFYVMPFVDGENLRARLERERQLPIDEALRIATSVASALDYAHRHGVIHRDLKPENILLQEGQPLVADFGIALAVSKAGGERLTQTGLSVGTPQYMSPEQAMGDRVIDGRADIYSLGAVLYEMLTGDPPHVGSSSQAVVARVLTEQPRGVRQSRSAVSEQVEYALMRALEKLPADRFSSARAFADALEGKGTTAGRTSASRRSSGRGLNWRTALPWSAATVLALGAWWVALRARTTEPRVLRYTLNTPVGQRFADVGATALAFSPDGKFVVYSGRSPRGTQLYYRRLDQMQATPIPDTENSLDPFISPDGEWVGFTTISAINKVSLRGGAASKLAEGIRPQGSVWGPNEQIIIGTATGLVSVPSSGGKPVWLTRVDTTKGENGHSMPRMTPDGKAVLFWVTTRAGGSTLAVLHLADKSVDRISGNAANPVALDAGVLVFGREDGTLNAVPFDATRTRSIERAVVVQDGVLARVQGGAAAALSVLGDLAFVHGARESVLTILDDKGKRISASVDGRPFSSPRFSPDGRRVAVSVGSSQHSDVWVYDLASGVLQRMTTKASASRPTWTADGRHLAYVAYPNGDKGQAWWTPSDGSGAEEPILTLPGSVIETVFSPDGRYAVVCANQPITRRDLLLVDLKGDRTPVPLVKTDFGEWMPAISPDGRWLAYVSDETGAAQVFVQPFPHGGARVQVSPDGGGQPRWTHDSRALIYSTGDLLVKASLAADASMRATRQDTLFEARPTASIFSTAQFDVSPSGTIVITRSANNDAELEIVINWVSELRAKMAASGKR